MTDSEEIMKALVTLAIEQTLGESTNAAFKTVTNKLLSDFDCDLSDCFEKPEYLKAVLKELYGESHNKIVNSIEQELKDFTYNKKIKTFLEVLLQ